MRWIRDCAVYHHRPLNDGIAVPNGAITLLATEADRIAAALERKPQDENQESSPDARKRDLYRRTRLVATPSTIHLDGRSKTERRFYPILAITPDALFDLGTEQTDKDAIRGYQEAWEAFKQAYSDLARRTEKSLEGYIEGLIALSERFCWSIPSSTIDDPDVSLHDHSRVAAAVSACLYQHHKFVGDLKDEASVKDRTRKKFRLLAGDLSGIQSTLFRLQSENVKGLARLLRGRSFRMQLITEAGARRACQAFGLPLYNVIQLAGGRFLLILPETGPGEAEEIVDRLRSEIDDWMLKQYVGDLVLNLGLTPPLSANDLINNLLDVYAQLGAVAETAKLRPLSTQAHGVITLPFNPDLEICGACGVRPAITEGREGRRCSACAAETELGRRLPKAEAIAIHSTPHAGAGSPIFGLDFEALIGGQLSGAVTGFRCRPSEIAEGRPAADRFFEAYTPKHTASTLKDERLTKARQESGDDEAPEEGDLLTFAELAARSTDKDRDGHPIGRPMLALLKADVDNLGKVFTEGLGNRRSLSRTAALSRLMDAFFTGWLPDHLREKFPYLYTVYAGGDDMMVLGPWFDVLRFAPSLREAFSKFSGHNPSLTLSAGIELFDPRTPISLAAAKAEERLEAAKQADKNKDRICAISPPDAPMKWEEWDKVLDEAEELHQLIGEKKISIALLYRLLTLDNRRRDAKTDPACADWRAKLGYTLYRSVHKEEKFGNQSVRERLLSLMGVDEHLGDLQTVQPFARAAITIALYRNRWEDLRP